MKKNAEAGEYTVIARMKNNNAISTHYSFYVEKPSRLITSVTASKTQYTIEQNEDVLLEEIKVNTIDGSDIDPQALNWKIGNSDIISFDTRTLTVSGLKAGKTTLVGMAADGSGKK